MKILILLFWLSLISCEREALSPKELVYFHIYVTGDPFVASVILDKPAESDFVATFNWYDSEMQPHLERLDVSKGECHAQHATGIDSVGNIRGVEMLDWTKESDHYRYVPDQR